VIRAYRLNFTCGLDGNCLGGTLIFTGAAEGAAFANQNLIVFYGQGPKGAGINTDRARSAFISINFNSQVVTSRINFITHYRNSGHDTKLNTLAANVAALFDIGLALFYGQQTFRAILIANGTAAAFLSIDHYFGSTTIFHKSNSALSFEL
jgi:hypothetical protein